MPMGVTIRELIEKCGGGVQDGRQIKAVFPGGPAFSMVTADQLDLPWILIRSRRPEPDWVSAGPIVIDDATCMVAATLKYSNFFKGESCGQCPPCRMGTINLATLMTRSKGPGQQKDHDSLLQLCGFVKGTGYCTLVTGAAVLVQSSREALSRKSTKSIFGCNVVRSHRRAVVARTKDSISAACESSSILDGKSGQVRPET